MIEKVGKGEYQLTCDICDESVSNMFQTFASAIEHKKYNGWKSRKRRGYWDDVCPKCTREALSEKQNDPSDREGKIRRRLPF